MVWLPRPRWRRMERVMSLEYRMHGMSNSVAVDSRHADDDDDNERERRQDRQDERDELLGFRNLHLLSGD